MGAGVVVGGCEEGVLMSECGRLWYVMYVVCGVAYVVWRVFCEDSC